jgi:hypothetical protein
MFVKKRETQLFDRSKTTKKPKKKKKEKEKRENIKKIPQK